MDSYTHLLAKHIDKIDFSALSDEVEEEVRYKLLDWLGCEIGAQKSAFANKLQCAFGGSIGSHSVLGQSGTYSLGDTAFYQAATGHLLELDDVYKPAISHPGAIVIPTCLTVGVDTSSDFKNFALGVVAGYEVMAILGANLSPSHYRYWHTTGTVGAFCSAASAAKLYALKLSEIQTALSLVATMASGLTCVFGTEAKLITVGNAVRNGILAANLSHNNLTAPDDPIGASNGFAKAVSTEELDFERYFPKRLAIIDTSYKIYPSCGHTHTALDAVFQLTEEISFDFHDIKRIEVRAYQSAVELTGKFKNKNEKQAKFSLPYCLAAAIVFGKIDLLAFSTDSLMNEDVIDLGRKIYVYEDEESNARFPEIRRETVTIFFNNGQVISKTLDINHGFPERRVLQNKFLSLAECVIGRSNAEAIIDATLSLSLADSLRDYNNLITEVISNGLYNA